MKNRTHIVPRFGFIESFKNRLCSVFAVCLHRYPAVFLGCVLIGLPAYAGMAGGGYPGHQVVVGDFNGDGWGDLLLQPVSGYNQTAVFLSLMSGDFGESRTWTDPHANERWNASVHRVYVGDFSGDGRDGLFMQADNGSAESAVMLSSASGRFSHSNQGQFTDIGGMDVSHTTHDVVVGDFDANGRDDLLFQATNGFSKNGIALSGTEGQFTSLASTWNNGLLGLEWSSDLTAITAGDFAGNGRAQLLLRSRNVGVEAHVVALDSEEQPRKITQHWPDNWLGLDWTPSSTNVIAADLNGDGRTDLLLQPKAPGGKVAVLLANAHGHFTKIAAEWPADSNGRDWSSESYRLVAEPASPGHGATLLMVPEQPGLAYQRVHFGQKGHPSKITTLPAPPADVFTANTDGASVSASTLQVQSASAATTPIHAVGTLGGKFAVDRTGAAHYSIPIKVAPGVNGLQPKLTITYNSRGGASQLGLGWSLSGVSAVSRCPESAAVGQTPAPINMAESDDFCLSGTHLVPNGGWANNGKSGAVYHEPKASFMKIVSNGTQGNGPDSFTVWSKDGLTRQFGTTSDSQLQTGTTFNHTVMSWLLHEVSDHWGNYISYSYTKSQNSVLPGADTGDQLTEIDYGNGSGQVVGKIVFSYQFIAPAAYHTTVTYTDGFHHEIQSDLSSITVYSGGSKLWTYNLSYAIPTPTGAPRLASVEQCDAAGVCLMPATFKYASPSVGLMTGQYSLKEILADDSVNALHFGNFTDSGVSDALFSKNNHWNLNESVNPSIASGPAPDQALVFDANNDGHSDVVFPINYNQLELAEWKNGALAVSAPCLL